MPNRLSENTRIWCRRYLAVRDGNKCVRCGKVSQFIIDIVQSTPATQNKPSSERPATRFDDMDIDHKDGNKHNWNPENLRLLCHGCNRGVENSRQSSKSHSATFSLSQQQETASKMRLSGHPATRIAHTVVDYTTGTAQMQASFLFAGLIEEYCLKQVRDRGFVFKKELECAAAEHAGCSISTAKDHIAKMTSWEGVFKEIKDMLGGTAITWKDHLQPTDEGEKNGHKGINKE